MSGDALPFFARSASPGSLAIAVSSDPRAAPVRHVLTPTGASIGSNPRAELCLQDETVPILPEHGAIVAIDGSFYLQPKAPGFSLNGARVNDGRHALKSGDRIQLGRYDLMVEDAMAGRPDALAGWRPAAGPGFPEASPGRDSLAEMLDEWQLDTPLDAPAPSAQPIRPASMSTDPAPSAAGNTDPLAAIISELQTALAVPPDPISPVERALPPEPDRVVSVPPSSPAEPLLSAPSAPPSYQNAALRLLAGSDDAASALAAFWWNLGMPPPGTTPGEMFRLMGELGRTLREFVVGVATLSREQTPARGGADAALLRDNPLDDGIAGLQRHLETGHARDVPLAAHVRALFEALASHDRTRADIVAAAAHTLVQSLGAHAIKERVRPLAHRSWMRSQDAEYWRLFNLMSNDIGHMAELRFHRELDDALRGTRRLPATPSVSSRIDRSMPIR